MKISYIRSHFCFGITIICFILEPCKVHHTPDNSLASIMLKYLGIKKRVKLNLIHGAQTNYMDLQNGGKEFSLFMFFIPRDFEDN